MIKALIEALVFALVFKALVASAFVVPSGSMRPTLQPGDYFLAEFVSYRVVEPDRGDVVVFDREGITMVKRVVAIPGDSTPTHGAVPDGHVFVQGDNHANSLDSRAWGFLPTEDVYGRALFVHWSQDRDGIHPERFGKMLGRQENP